MTMKQRSLTPDDLATILLCARLDAHGRESAGARPLELNEWNLLVWKIRESPFASPGALLGTSTTDLAAGLGLNPAEAARIAALLDRGGQLAVELDRLAARGIGVVTLADRDRYPARLRARLREGTPPVLFYAGDLALVRTPGLAVVGSRDVDSAGEEFAGEIARRVAREGLTLVSGAARGVDSIAMTAALEAGGIVVGVLADSLERALASATTRAAVVAGTCLMLTPFHPRAPFSVGAAMGRNKLIYALADHALVVAATQGKGGTWFGAVEALTAKWTRTPVFVREPAEPVAWSAALRAVGAKPFPTDLAALDESLAAFLARAAEPAAGGATDVDSANNVSASDPDRANVSPRPPLPHGGRGDGVDGSVPLEQANPAGLDESARLLAFVDTPRAEKEIADHLGVSRGLAHGILRDLLARGSVIRTERPVRYQRNLLGL